MTALKDAFRRKAKMKKHQITQDHMHWRHKENGWEVVSTVLCEQWDNAVHPEEHNDFQETTVGTVGDGITRYSPETQSDWETFYTEETRMPMIVDQEAYQQFESAFRNEIDYLNAEAVAEFLHGRFEAEYDLESGDEDKDTFTRTFPYTRDTILSEMPSRQELQVLQFTLNKMANVAEQNDTVVSFRKVIQLFDRVENGDPEDLIETAISYIEPALDTVTKPARDENGTIQVDESGEPVTVEQPDPDVVEQTRTKLSSQLC